MIFENHLAKYKYYAFGWKHELGHIWIRQVWYNQKHPQLLGLSSTRHALRRRDQVLNLCGSRGVADGFGISC